MFPPLQLQTSKSTERKCTKHPFKVKALLLHLLVGLSDDQMRIQRHLQIAWLGTA